MNFKHWLLLTEELKSANAPNPSLTTKAKPLDAPNLSLATKAKPLPDVNSIRYIKNAQNFKELAIYYGINGSAPSAYNSNEKISSLAKWLDGKKSRINPNEAADKEIWDNMVSLSKNWNKERFPHDLPLVWRDVKKNAWQGKNQKTSSENFKELAYYYGRNRSGPSPYDSHPDIAYLGKWHNNKKQTNSNSNPHEESDNKTWADMVALSKTSGWIDPVTQKPFLYTNLPIDWRKVKTTSSENFKELAYYFGRNESGPSQMDSNEKISSLAKWHTRKKNININNPQEESDNETWAEIVSKFTKWIDPVTKKPFLYTNLPIDWRDVKPNRKQELYQKNQTTSSENFKELAYYYGRNGGAPSQNDSHPDIVYLGRWHNAKKQTNSNSNPHEESDNKTWADMVAKSKTSGWIDPVTKKPFLYKDLPIDWRKVKTRGEKSLGEKLVANILTELGIKNDTEHRDEACFNKRCLPFDFSITHNGKKYLEFHGEQHYVPAYFGSTEDMTDQEIAKHALDKFKSTKKNDTIKYDHCVKYKIPFLVIPYWIKKDLDLVKSTIIEFLKTNKFNETFAKPDVPPKYKAYHDRMLKITQCFASGKVNCKELFKKQKTTTSVTQEPTKTFEQFLINKNFINI
jgi:hypothetical protein